MSKATKKPKSIKEINEKIEQEIEQANAELFNDELPEETKNNIVIFQPQVNHIPPVEVERVEEEKSYENEEEYKEDLKFENTIKKFTTFQIESLDTKELKDSVSVEAKYFKKNDEIKILISEINKKEIYELTENSHHLITDIDVESCLKVLTAMMNSNFNTIEILALERKTIIEQKYSQASLF